MYVNTVDNILKSYGDKGKYFEKGIQNVYK